MKAKLIYDYVQQKSRYVSIQVGIGGWKPMDASDVDRLGYGDCKGLTNYTKAFEAVCLPTTQFYMGIATRKILNLTCVYARESYDFSDSLWGDYIWLECTSQDDPFVTKVLLLMTEMFW
jgi:hypothetical protein